MKIEEDQLELDIIRVDSDSFSEVSGADEDEYDFGKLTTDELQNVAVATTDWTTETILSQLDKDNIYLNPRFQRRDAWEAKRKSQFIESLILGLPVPQIVLAERPEKKGTYIVLDGKQRLLCLRQFASNSPDSEFQSFNLTNLIVRSDLNGKSFNDFQNDPRLNAEATALENYGIRAVILRNWRSERLLGHIFLRLNMGSKPLSPQELRQALHPGPFLDFVDEASSRSKAIMDILGRSTPDFRMRDVELILRYLGFKYLLHTYHGNLKEFLDDTCKIFNSNWPGVQPKVEESLRQLDAHHELIKFSFGASYNYGKWLGDRYEKRFNRAIFDILLQSLALPGVYEACFAAPQVIPHCFKRICESDPKFVDSIERTTKSTQATFYRFESWRMLLSKELGVNIESPLI